MGTELSIGLVFLAGMASFLSPCVLPIVPAYLSLISGLSFNELQDSTSIQGARWKLFGSAIAFLLGFSIVVVGLMGGLVTLFGELDQVWRQRLSIGFGAIAFIFALHMLGLFRIKALYRERRFHMATNKLGYLGALLIGAAFAFGWTPCIGPILGAVFGLSAGTARAGLLAVYMLGLALPFLLAAVFVNLFLDSLRKMTRYLRVVEIVSGVLLLLMGIILITNHMEAFSLKLGDFMLKMKGVL